jgi:formamidopyrimidine-DNA glycosylase
LSKDIKRLELQKIIGCVRQVMDFSIAHGGSSENTFVNAEGKQGKMQNFFKVYRQTGSPCPECGGKIVRTVVGGRGTHYCPACQH